MPDPTDFMLADLVSRYAGIPDSDAYTRLYKDDAQFSHVFSVLHQRLNEHFESINGRAKSTRHYWAESSRDMLALIEEVSEMLEILGTAGVEVTFEKEYRDAIDHCAPWLSMSGGSTLPDNFEPIHLVKFRPVFQRPETRTKLKKHKAYVQLRLVGEGSYARVFSYVDPDYGIKFAIKRAKHDLSERDLHRFRQEFNVLKRLSFPYVVEVYQYDEDRNEYKMEFCDATLRAYIARRNDRLSFVSRKRIALQFLYGINYIHHEGLLHRDVSLQNVLLRIFDSGAVLVKLSDFGLVKDHLASQFTLTGTEMRGTIRDPTLSSFKEYNVLNEIYSLGWVLSYIFTGKEALRTGEGDVNRIIQKCTTGETAQRYPRVMELIADVERLEVELTDTPA